MNRIETRIVIMVTNRLAAAKDSDAKAEMIEELSENLYQRYQELAGGGMTEEEALSQTFDSLGDVDELLAFLQETERGTADGAAAFPQIFRWQGGWKRSAVMYFTEKMWPESSAFPASAVTSACACGTKGDL